MRRPDPTALSPSPAVIVAYLLVVGLVAGAATVSGHEQATLDVEIEIVDVVCTLPSPSSGADWNVTQLEVQLSNHDDVVVDPVFRVPHQNWHVRNTWPITAGPSTLEPGATATYRIVTPGDAASIHNASAGVVFVANSGTQQRASTPATRFDCPPAPGGEQA